MIANPLTGVGAGAWEVQIPLYQRIGEGMETDYYAHNEFLQLLSEYGVVAGGLFIAVLLAYLLISAGKTWRLQGDGLAEAPLRAMTLVSLLALLIVSNAGFPWRLASTGTLFALCLAVMAASDARLDIRESFFAAPLRWRPGLSKAVLVWLLGCTVLAAYITQRAAEAERKIVHAIHLARAAAQTGNYEAKQLTERKTQWLQGLREGIAINPHLRKLTPMVADQLAVVGDWANVVWILESVVTSRPNVADLWADIVLGYMQLGQSSRANDALKQLLRLQPDTPRTLALEVMVLSRFGNKAQAAKMLTDYFDQGRYEYDLVQIGYSLGLEMHNWLLAIRALELLIEYWPEQAADGYLRLGRIYTNPEVHADTKALAAFRAGLQAVPPAQQDNYRKQVPEKYRARL